MTEQQAINNYNKALDHARVTLKDADPRPGKMTDEQNAAQCSLVSAWLDVEETCGPFEE